MKRILMFATALLFAQILMAQEAEEKPIPTEIKEITVFTEGCQITRTQTVTLQKGVSLLKFTGLTPYLDETSVQVKMDKEAVMLSVKFQLNYDSNKKKEGETETLTKKIDALKEQIKTEQIDKEIIRQKMEFLKVNQEIGGQNSGIQSTQFKESYAFYAKEMSDLHLQYYEKERIIKKLSDEKSAYELEYNEMARKEVSPAGELLVKMDIPQAGSYRFEISYIAENAGWTPSYDIVAKNTNAPIKLIYKADVHQNTKEEWKDVKIRLSSSNPKRSGEKIDLRPYFLNYRSRPHDYTRQDINISSGFGQIHGTIKEQGTYEPIPFANVAIIQNEKVLTGTQTDFDGNFLIREVLNGVYTLRVSNIGYHTFERQNITLTSSGAKFDVLLESSTIELEYVDLNMHKMPNRSAEGVVTSVGGIFSKDGDLGTIRGSRSGEQLMYIDGMRVSNSETKENAYSNISPTQQIQTPTNFEFDILSKYTVPSDGKNYSILINEHAIPTTYRHFCAPKADDDAYLLAEMTDWTRYNLLPGASNIFFENTYIGKSSIDPRKTSDTLEISLGIDKGVIVKRELEKTFSTRKVIGNKQEDTKAWKISVRNNKSERVNLVLTDQVPVSTLSEIEVKALNLSEGAFDEKTGEAKWEISLDPNQSKSVELIYSVRYPKGQTLYID